MTATSHKHTRCIREISDVVANGGRVGAGATIPHSPKFLDVGKLSEYLLLSENFRQKMHNFGPKAPIFFKLAAKLKIRAPIISSVGNLQLSVC